MTVASISASGHTSAIHFSQEESTLYQRISRVAWEVLTTTISVILSPVAIPVAIAEMCAGGSYFFSFLTWIDSRTVAKAYLFAYAKLFNPANGPDRFVYSCVVNNRCQILEEVVKRGFPLDPGEFYRESALQWAFDHNREMFEYLLDHGADINLDNSFLLKQAIERCDFNQIEDLLNKGASGIDVSIHSLKRMILSPGPKILKERVISFLINGELLTSPRAVSGISKNQLCELVKVILEEHFFSIVDQLMPIIKEKEEFFSLFYYSLYTSRTHLIDIPHLEDFFMLLLDNGVLVENRYDFPGVIDAFLENGYLELVPKMILAHPSFVVDRRRMADYLVLLLNSNRNEEEIIAILDEIKGSIITSFTKESYYIVDSFLDVVEDIVGHRYLEIIKWFIINEVNDFKSISMENIPFFVLFSPQYDYFSHITSKNKRSFFDELHVKLPHFFSYQVDRTFFSPNFEIEKVILFFRRLDVINFHLITLTDEEIESAILNLSLQNIMKEFRDVACCLFWENLSKKAFSIKSRLLENFLLHVKQHHISLLRAIESAQTWRLRDDLKDLIEQGCNCKRIPAVDSDLYCAIESNASSYSSKTLTSAFHSLHDWIDNITETTFEELPFAIWEINLQQQLRDLARNLHLFFNNLTGPVLKEVLRILEMKEIQDFFENDEYKRRYDKWDFYDSFSKFYFDCKRAKIKEKPRQNFHRSNFFDDFFSGFNSGNSGFQNNTTTPVKTGDHLFIMHGGADAIKVLEIPTEKWDDCSTKKEQFKYAERMWRKAQLKCHPDKPGGSEEQTKKINEALDKLRKICSQEKNQD